MISRSSPTMKTKDEHAVVFRERSDKPTEKNSVINRLLGSVFRTKKIHPEGVSGNKRKIVPDIGGSRRRHTKKRRTYKKK